MEEFKEQQELVNGHIRELITRLSRQVLQIANNSGVTRETSLGNPNHSLTILSRVDFPNGEDA